MAQGSRAGKHTRVTRFALLVGLLLRAPHFVESAYRFLRC